MIVRSYDNLHSLIGEFTDEVALMPAENLNFINSADVQAHNVLLSSSSLDYEFDIKWAWHQRTRWNTLVRQYIDAEALDIWLDTIERKMSRSRRGQAALRTKTVKPRRGGRAVVRQWGSCMLGFGFRLSPHPEITIHSRTTFLGHLAPLDLNVARALAVEIADRLDLDLADFTLVWFIEAAQFHVSRSYSHWFSPFSSLTQDEFMEYDREEAKGTPGLYGALKQRDKFRRDDEAGVLYGDYKYATLLRPRKRYHTEVLGPEHGKQFVGGPHLTAGKSAFPPLPSIPITTLDFTALKAGEAPEDAEFLDDLRITEALPGDEDFSDPGAARD